MNSPISRREFLALSGGVVADATLTRATSSHDSPSHPIPRFEVPLRIPRVLEPIRTDATTDYYELVQREERVEILPGRHTTIWGYDGTFPGPTIKARRGRTVIVRHINRLGSPTVVHLHGGLTPPESDGFPMDREDVSVIARFDGYRGRYLLHCHNLEHEDHSMMARFDVV